MEIALREAWSSENTSSLRSLAAQYGVPVSTLRDKLAGRLDRSAAQSAQQYLLSEQESALTRHGEHSLASGFLPSLAWLRCLVTDMHDAAQPNDPRLGVDGRYADKDAIHTTITMAQNPPLIALTAVCDVQRLSGGILQEDSMAVGYER